MKLISHRLLWVCVVVSVAVGVPYKLVEAYNAAAECRALTCDFGPPQVEQRGPWGTHTCMGCPPRDPCDCPCPGNQLEGATP